MPRERKFKKEVHQKPDPESGEPYDYMTFNDYGNGVVYIHAEVNPGNGRDWFGGDIEMTIAELELALDYARRCAAYKKSLTPKQQSIIDEWRKELANGQA